MHKLAICIPTLNRAAFIGETLESIATQLSDGVEVVIVDGGSEDGTDAIVAGFIERYPAIRYVKRDATAPRPSNAGFDRDCSYAVELADAEYCWLMTDDDILLSGAIDKVLEQLDDGHDLVVASCQIRDLSLTTTLVSSRPGLRRDELFQPDEWERFFRSSLVHLTFVGAVIIRRAIWVERAPERFFGSGFVHVGVIFSAPLPGTVLVLAAPLVVIRYGNALWNARGFEIFMLQWPELVWSFPGVSDDAKRSITPRHPWKSWRVLLLQRVYGRYSLREYHAYVAGRLASGWRRAIARALALLPRRLLYPLAWLYGRLLHSHPRYFLSTLRDGLQ